MVVQLLLAKGGSTLKKLVVALIGLVLISISICFGQTKKDEILIQSFVEMQEKIAYPTPNKACIQKILQKCTDDLYQIGFKAFSRDDFFHGHMLHYLELDTKIKPKDYQLAGILWHMQEGKVFNKETRSWVQWYSPSNEVQAPILAAQQIHEKSWDLVDDYRYLEEHGTIFPSLLCKEVCSYVTVYFYPIHGTDQLATSDKNVVKIQLKNDQKVFLAVEYRKS